MRSGQRRYGIIAKMIDILGNGFDLLGDGFVRLFETFKNTEISVEGDLKMSGKKFWSAVLGVIGIIAVIIGLFGMFTNVPAGMIAVIQAPISGIQTVYTEPGVKLQAFGRVTMYPRSGIFEFLQPIDPDDPTQAKYYNPKDDKSFKITFSDAGDGWLPGSIRYDYPLDHEKILLLHRTFNNHDNVVRGLIEKTIERSIYMSGPLMTSIESARSRKSELPQVIEDQARNGLYSVVTKEVVVEDEITKEKKTVKQAEIIKDPKAPGGRARQEESVLSKYGVSLSNLSMGNLSYSKTVRDRLKILFDSESDIQVAMLNAKRAEQDRKTAEEVGRKTETEKKWAAQAILTEQVTNAQREKEVAEKNAEREKNVALLNAQREKEVAALDKETAALYKDATLLRADADSKARKMLMDADGALDKKIEAYKYGVEKFATMIAEYKGNWVPTYIVGAGSNGSYNAAETFMNFMNMDSAKKLSLDLGLPKSK